VSKKLTALAALIGFVTVFVHNHTASGRPCRAANYETEACASHDTKNVRIGGLTKQIEFFVTLDRIKRQFLLRLGIASQSGAAPHYIWLAVGKSPWLSRREGFPGYYNAELISGCLSVVSQLESDCGVSARPYIAERANPHICSQLPSGGVLSPLREPIRFQPKSNRGHTQNDGEYRQYERVGSDRIIRRPLPKGFFWHLWWYAIGIGGSGGLLLCWLLGVFGSSRDRDQREKAKRERQGRANDGGPVDFSM
jgi:hypothetical protein